VYFVWQHPQFQSVVSMIHHGVVLLGWNGLDHSSNPHLLNPYLRWVWCHGWWVWCDTRWPTVWPMLHHRHKTWMWCCQNTDHKQKACPSWHEFVMERMWKESHTILANQKRDEEIRFRDWREKNIYEFANEWFYKSKEWAKGEAVRGAALTKCDRACRELKEKEMDKLELLWKKTQWNSI